jgi:hypothetical protein
MESSVFIVENRGTSQWDNLWNLSLSRILSPKKACKYKPNRPSRNKWHNIFLIVQNNIINTVKKGACTCVYTRKGNFVPVVPIRRKNVRESD